MDAATRALVRFAVTFGMAWIAIAMVAAPGPAAWVALAGDRAQAGVFFALFALSSAGGAAAGGRAMDRWGRPRVLAVAHALTGVGFGVAGLGLARGSLPLFAAGDVLLAAGIGVVYLTRVAAAELFAPAQRARAMARVQVMATVGAVGGPLVGALAPPGAVWLVAPPIFLVNAVLVWRASAPAARSPGPVAAPSTATAAASLRFPLATGVAALVCAQAAMIAVMGVAGAALAHAGHGSSTTGLVMAVHFVGMFGLSLVVGRVADRAGRRLTVLAGLALLAAGGATTALVGGAVGLGAGLLMIGVGWSFSYIGGSVVLTDVVPAHRRARVVGLVDFATATLAALAAYLGGQWYASRGLTGLGLVAVALMVLPIALAAVLREPRPGSYSAQTS